MRSADAQKQTLGFTFQEIQQELCRVWNLPELLRTLIDEESAGTPRVQNVTLAVRLARHSSYSWEDPALPDDYKDIGELLNVTPETVRQRLGLLPMPAREADGEAALA